MLPSILISLEEELRLGLGLIEVHSEHANALGLKGYDRIDLFVGWVGGR